MSSAGPQPTAKGIAELNRRLTTGSSDVAWVRVGQLFEGTGQHALPDAHLVYDSLQIRYVGTADRPPPASVLANGQTTPNLELPGYTALPGLTDAHAHLFLDGQPIDLETRKKYLTQTSDWLLERARSRRQKILRHGVTAVRDAGDKDSVGLRLAAECASQHGRLSTDPYLDSPGAAIHHHGRYGSFMSRPVEQFDSAARCVADRVAAGADRIKLIATGIINFKAGRVTAAPQMTADEVGDMVQAADRHGRQTFAHASGSDGIENVLRGGVTTVEHGFFITRQQLERMVTSGIGWCPTFAPVQVQIDCADQMGWSVDVVQKLRRIIEGHEEALRLAHELNVTLIAGSDAGSCGVPHGLGLLREMELMQRAGLPPGAVLHSATGAGAGLLKFHEPIGLLAPRHRARMIFTRHSPLDSVINLQREKIVVFDGRVIECEPAGDAGGL